MAIVKRIKPIAKLDRHTIRVRCRFAGNLLQSKVESNSLAICRLLSKMTMVRHDHGAAWYRRQLGASDLLTLRELPWCQQASLPLEPALWQHILCSPS